MNAQDFISKNLSDEQILELIEQHRPLKGGEVHSDLKSRLGSKQMIKFLSLTNSQAIDLYVQMGHLVRHRNILMNT